MELETENTPREGMRHTVRGSFAVPAVPPPRVILMRPLGSLCIGLLPLRSHEVPPMPNSFENAQFPKASLTDCSVSITREPGAANCRGVTHGRPQIPRVGLGERRHPARCRLRPTGGALFLGLQLPSAPTDGTRTGASGSRRRARREV